MIPATVGFYMDNGYDTGFRVSNLSRSTILVGTLILVGLPLSLFAVVFLTGVGFEFAFYMDLVLLYYFVIGAYAYARWGRAFPPRSAEKEEHE